MTLQYQCRNCGQTIITPYHKRGDMAVCHKCGAPLVVPANAIEIDQAQDVKGTSSDRQSKIPSVLQSGERSRQISKPPVPIAANKTPQPNDRFPGFWQAIGLLGILIGLTIVISLPLGLAQVMTGFKSIIGLIIGQIITAAIFVVIYIYGIKRIKRPFKIIFPFGKIQTTLVIPILITMVGATILLSEIDNFVRLFIPMPEFFKSLFSNLFENRWFFLIGGVIVAPITEEMFCRGLVLRGFLFRYSKLKAIILSAFIFGLAHMNPWQFISAFLLGLIFAWWFIQTGSLITTMLAHAFANGIVFVAILMNVNIPGFNPEIVSPAGFQPWWFDLSGVILLIIGLWWFDRIAKAIQNTKEFANSPSDIPIQT